MHRHLQPLDIVGVMATSYCPAFVGQIDRIHWDTSPVWDSLIDLDPGEWRSAQLQHVIGRVQNFDPAPHGWKLSRQQEGSRRLSNL
jgi:hypothetical protein